MAEGLRFVFHNPLLRAIACTTASSNLASGIVAAVEVVFLVRTVHASPAVIGLLFTLGGVGGVIGALVAGPLARRIGGARATIVGILTTVGALLIPLTEPKAGLLLFGGGMFFISFGAVVYNINQVSFRQRLCPDRLLGRMNATMRFIVWGVLPIGALVRGCAGQRPSGCARPCGSAPQVRRWPEYGFWRRRCGRCVTSPKSNTQPRECGCVAWVAMRAIGIMEFGGPEVLRLVDLPDPQAGPGELRLRVHAASVNPTDTVLRSGGRAERLKDVRPPHVPGMDAAGVLEQIGEGVDTDLRVGERVMAIVVPLGQHGAYAERVVVPSESVVRSPAGVSDAQAATIPMNGLTVRLALDELGARARSDPGGERSCRSRWWVCGAAGKGSRPPGHCRCWARRRGTGSCARGATRSWSGATTFAAGVRRIVPDGADGLIDAAVMNARAVPAVRDGGRVATLRGYEGGEMESRGITFFPGFRPELRHGRTTSSMSLRDLAERGALTLRVARTLPAAEAPEAHRLLEAGGVRGRLVLEF